MGVLDIVLHWVGRQQGEIEHGENENTDEFALKETEDRKEHVGASILSAYK